MSDKRDDITSANEAAHEEFEGGKERKIKRLKDAKDTQEVNEAANAEFNGDDDGQPLGDQVGGLHGSPD
ncbi:hypothetical protein [Devosia sp. RR2S18]|uniref:hypothetical protein n=1 Tax=Devosia rhizosphaerae TaxID=3049774 RepID=UPI002541A809|nr:hypothetical protein [Devosia sp. RR2S18]WIJ24620.1 hypothetical protein QOV41_16620 [Devosia sp. RR2S18]